MVRRRVASVAFVALVVGCSYDWNIGTGSADSPPSSGDPAGPPSTPTADSGAARDTGTPDTGSPPAGPRECGENCECRNDETCTFTCSTGRCNARCVDESTCTLTCSPTTDCTLTCEDESECSFDCSRAAGGTCDLTCKDRADCKGMCGPATLCSQDCARDCAVTCAPGAICTPS